MFSKIGALKNFANFTRKHLSRSRPATLLKIDSNTGISLRFFRNTFLYRTPPVADHYQSYRRVADDYRRVTDDYKRVTDEYRRVTNDYRRVTDESQTTTDKSQTSHRRLWRIIPKVFLNTFTKHYFQKGYGFQMPLWKVVFT